MVQPNSALDARMRGVPRRLGAQVVCWAINGGLQVRYLKKPADPRERAACNTPRVRSVVAAPEASAADAAFQ